MIALLDKIAGRQERSEAKAQDDFRKLADRLAAEGGKEPSEAEVTAALAAAGKTIGELREAVQLTRKRRELQSKLAASEGAEKEIDGLREKIRAADAELDAAEQKHAETVFPLDARLREIAAAGAAATAARNELLRTCPDERLVAREAELRREMNELDNRRKELERDLAEKQSALLAEKSRLRPGADREWLGKGEGRGGDAEEVERIGGMVERAEARLTEVREAIDKALAEQNALVEEMIGA
jgi:hypothetical protein